MLCQSQPEGKPDSSGAQDLKAVIIAGHFGRGEHKLVAGEKDCFVDLSIVAIGGGEVAIGGGGGNDLCGGGSSSG